MKPQAEEPSCAPSAVAEASGSAEPEVERRASAVRRTEGPSPAKPSLLSLFHGPLGRADGFDAYIEAGGGHVDCYDLEISSDHDLCDEELFSRILRRIQEGHYDDGALLAPPCSTFAGARTASDGGPALWRGPEPPDLASSAGPPAQVRQLTRAQLLEFWDAYIAPGGTRRRRLATHVFSPSTAPPDLALEPLSVGGDEPAYFPPAVRGEARLV